APGAEVKRLSIGIAPREVMRMFRTNDGSEMFSLRRQNPKTARTRHIKIASLVHLHSIERVFAGRTRHVEEEFAVLERTVRLDFVTHDNLLRFIPIADVEEFLVRRKRDAVR